MIPKIDEILIKIKIEGLKEVTEMGTHIHTDTF